MLLSAGTAKNILHRMKQKFIPAFWSAASTNPKSFGLPPRAAMPDEQRPLETTEDVFFASQIPLPVQPSLCPQDKAVKAGPRCSCLSILSPCMARSLHHVSASTRHEDTIPSAAGGPNRRASPAARPSSTPQDGAQTLRSCWEPAHVLSVS